MGHRLPAQALGHVPGCDLDPAHDFVHVNGDADRPRLVPDPALDPLLDPPVRVRGELVPPLVLELFHRPQEPEVPFLDQIHEGEAAVRVLLGDVHDQPQVGDDEIVPRLVQRVLVSAHLAQRGCDLRVPLQGGIVDQLGHERLELLERPRRAQSRAGGVAARTKLRHSSGRPSASFAIASRAVLSWLASRTSSLSSRSGFSAMSSRYSRSIGDPLLAPLWRFPRSVLSSRSSRVSLMVTVPRLPNMCRFESSGSYAPSGHSSMGCNPTSWAGRGVCSARRREQAESRVPSIMPAALPV